MENFPPLTSPRAVNREGSGQSHSPARPRFLPRLAAPRIPAALLLAAAAPPPPPISSLLRLRLLLLLRRSQRATPEVLGANPEVTRAGPGCAWRAPEALS